MVSQLITSTTDDVVVVGLVDESQIILLAVSNESFLGVETHVQKHFLQKSFF